MSAIGAVGGYGSIGGYYSIYQNKNTGPAGMEPVEWVTRAQTAPVPAVDRLPAVRRGAAQAGQEDGFPFPTMREGADPAEMAVRSRIRYLDGKAEDLNNELLGWDQGKGMEKLLNRGQEQDGLKTGREENGQPDGLKTGSEAEETKSPQETMEEAECQTCKKRKYQDGSDDPGVSFKTATNIAPERVASAVRGHEQEHVVREQAKAQREDRKVVSQSVTLHTAICPECGDVYISGGTTRTTTKANPVQEAEQPDSDKKSGFQAFA